MRQTKTLQWIILGILAVITFILGIAGFYQLHNVNCRPNCGQNYGILDLAYLSLQLFVLNTGAVVVGEDWPLEVARWLAPAIAGYGFVQAVLFLFAEQFGQLRLRRLRNHVIICGFGRKGQLLAQDFQAQGYRVVIIEPHATEADRRYCRERQYHLLASTATDISVLKNAQLQDAKYLISVCGNDATNLEIAVRTREIMTSHNSITLTAFIHIANCELEQLLKVRELENLQTGLRIEYFNIYEQGAYALWQQFPAFKAETTANKNKPARILLIGTNTVSHYLALIVGNQWGRQLATHGSPMQLLWVDPAAKQTIERLQFNYPHWAKNCQCEALPLATDSPEFLRGDFLFDETGQPLVTKAYICLSDESECMRTGLALAYRLRNHHIQVIVQLNSGASLAQLLTGDEYLQAFPLFENTCRVELITYDSRERLAQAIHENYIKNARQQGQTLNDNPSLVAWKDLTEDLKHSNRQQAEHIFHKLERLGCRLTPFTGKTDNDFSFTPDEIEQLAEWEHERWMAERLSAGWQYAEGEKNIEQKTSPYLLPWSQLEDKVKDLDRNPVRDIPMLLAHAGIAIYRLQ